MIEPSHLADPSDNAAMRASVLVVTYHHDQYLSQALDSVLMQQTDFDFEIVIADDFSTDSTVAIIETYAARHPQIRVLPTSEHIGITRNYQRGFAACRGEFIAVIEGDDYWISPKKLQTAVQFLSEHSDCALCFHRVIRQDEVSNQFSTYPEFDARKDYGYYTARELARENFIPGMSACLYRRDAIMALDEKFWRLRLREWPFNIVIAQAGLIGYIAEILSIYRAHPNGIWSMRTLHHLRPELSEVLDSYNDYLGYKYDAEFQAFKHKLGVQFMPTSRSSLPVPIRRQRLRMFAAMLVPPILLPTVTRVYRKLAGRLGTAD